MALSCSSGVFTYRPIPAVNIHHFSLRLKMSSLLKAFSSTAFNRSASRTACFCLKPKTTSTEPKTAPLEERSLEENGESFEDVDNDDSFEVDESADEFREDENYDIIDEEMKELVNPEEPSAPQVGDGGEGGGVFFWDTTWGTNALSIAQEVIQSFGDEFEIFAFKATANGNVQVRIDKLSDKFGSPTVDEIESFTRKYLEHLEEAAQVGSVPENLALVVSSPGAERVVRIPKDLERFKHLPMYVRYVESTPQSEGLQKDGIFFVDLIEAEAGYCTWKLANVRVNRQMLKKGRTFNKKQQEWRLQTNFESLLLVRLYLEV